MTLIPFPKRQAPGADGGARPRSTVTPLPPTGEPFDPYLGRIRIIETFPTEQAARDARSHKAAA